MIMKMMSRVKKREGVNSSSRLRHPQLLLANNASLHHCFIINIITGITFIFNIISSRSPSPPLHHQHHHYITPVITFIFTITTVIIFIFNIISSPSLRHQHHHYMSQLLLLGKVEYGGGPIFKVVLEC